MFNMLYLSKIIILLFIRYMIFLFKINELFNFNYNNNFCLIKYNKAFFTLFIYFNYNLIIYKL